MSEYKPIPVEAAREIAAKYDKTMVVVLAWDPVHRLTHATSYGVSAFEKEQAAGVADICTEAIGGDLSKKRTVEDFHRNYDPALYCEASEILAEIFRRHGTTPHMLQRIERWRKAAGHVLREG